MISVFTPLSASGNPYIEETYRSLQAQTVKDFQWVVLENHGGVLPKKIKKDKRLSLYGDTLLEGIGAIKRRCCELAKGDLLLELDHDDLLHPQALEKTIAALEKADFAYSDTCEFRVSQGGHWAPNLYDSSFGWEHYPVTFQGHELLAHKQPAATPQNLRLVDWSPNHLRAWRTAAYWAVGGHNPSYPVIDDHELIVRMYLSGLTFKHIEECLYFYRVHDKNTVATDNQRIRNFTQKVYDEYITPLAEKFTKSQSYVDRMPTVIGGDPVVSPLRLIDLCGGIDTAPGYEPLDLSLGHDLNVTWPLEESSVGVIRAQDAIEHLKDPIHTMNEAHRVLAPGGFFLIRVPSTTGPIIRTPAMDGGEFHWVASAGRGAFQDPTHVSFWNENSFWYYTKATHARYLPAYTGRFQVARMRTFYPDDFSAQHAIPYVEAHLIALKEGYKPMGLVEI
jgi:SAM-dependent methyltransferase